MGNAYNPIKDFGLPQRYFNLARKLEETFSGKAGISQDHFSGMLEFPTNESEGSYYIPILCNVISKVRCFMIFKNVIFNRTSFLHNFVNRGQPIDDEFLNLYLQSFLSNTSFFR